MADIVLIHGMWSHAEVARPLRDRLEEVGHRVLAPDLPGHACGAEIDRAEQGKRSLSEYVDFIEEYIGKQNFVQPPILVGHSMGGLIAQIIATRISVRGVAILNSAGPAGVNHLYFRPVLSFLRTLLTPGFWLMPQKPTFREARKDLLRKVAPNNVSRVYETLVPESGWCLFEIVFWWLNFGGPTRIPCPTQVPMFIVSCGQDTIVDPSVSLALTQLYPQAEFQLFPDNGHWIFHESGDESIYEAIEWWIAATFEGEESFILKSHHLPHESAHPASSPQLSPNQPRGFESSLDHSRAVRRNADENSEAGRGSVLPR